MSSKLKFKLNTKKGTLKRKEMKKLEDITYRHGLIERYLGADTCVEEEQALADFYRHCEN